MTASPPSRTPARTAAQPDTARTALRYALVVTAGLVLLLVLVAGCGAAPLPPAAPSTIAPSTPVPP
ncbi:MAG: signal recognition particle-docking protein FtsY, partial [Actinomycetota bacterium]|nr:signal recognition particle-docking protein FtsY [Actinomycetota bacterium]